MAEAKASRSRVDLLSGVGVVESGAGVEVIEGFGLEVNRPPAATFAEQPSRPSIAVLPFRPIGGAGRYAAIADALPHELITELSRLRWLFGTACGSSFRLRASDAGMGEIGRLLGSR